MSDGGPTIDLDETPPWGADKHGRSDDEMALKRAASTASIPIGLALGSGGARGWAHIGVIQALERHGIVPDIITGTSAGALVGGIYTAGHLHTLEEFARSLNRRRMLRYVDLMFGGSGLVGGKKLTRLLDANLGDTQIEDLNRRFVAVTAELATGHEIWLRTGRLVDAMRASYAIPGVFSPQKIGGRWLIDGGLVNPVPVSVCRAFGARLVISVNLNAEVFGLGTLELGENFDHTNFDSTNVAPRHVVRFEKKPDRRFIRQMFRSGDGSPGVGTVLLAGFNIMQDRLARSRLAGDPADITIAPRVGHISMIDFDRAQESIELGMQAVEPALTYIDEALKVLS